MQMVKAISEKGAALLIACALFALGLLLPAQALALASAPKVTGTSVSAITSASAKLSATLDPGERATAYSFQYITQEDWEADGEEFAPADTHTVGEGEITEGLKEPHALEATVAGLSPATAYRARLFATNVKSPPGGSPGEAIGFATYPATPTFGPCPNDLFRSGGPGVAVPPTQPSALLPDCRAYEQVTPLDKDGGDAVQIVALLRSSADGDAATFGTTAGIPGAVGAQELPLFRADRSEAGWGTSGLQPPAAEAQNALIVGWLPDLSLFFLKATRFSPAGKLRALIATGAGAPSLQLTPYVSAPTQFAYAGASADGSVVLFESIARLPEEEGGPPLAGSLEGRPNLYAWDRASGRLSLAGRMNSLAESEADLPTGAFAGPYAWIQEKTAEGGSARGYYTQDENAVAEDGSVIFTAAGSGHLYERLNPTAPQSAMSGGECTEAAKACTIDLAATRRTPPDPAGQSPAAFQAASSDGRTAFFTSSEKLTDDANTGPEAAKPLVGRATLSGPEEEATETIPELLAGQHAVGIAISGGHIYWSDPNGGTIGRARLNGNNVDQVEPGFIEPGGTEFAVHPEGHPSFTLTASATPRYVAVGSCSGGGQCVYWTNPGPRAISEIPSPYFANPGELIRGGGTIGRAELDGSGAVVPGSVDPEFITGAADPEAIAVNAEHVYWVNHIDNAIARAPLDGGEAEQKFFGTGPYHPYGLALSATRVYWSYEVEQGTTAFSGIQSIPLEGGTNPEISGTGEGATGTMASGVAVDGPHLYWANRANGTIGRIRLPLEEPSDDADHHCALIARCEPEFLNPGGALTGLAADESGEHLFWSANGETPPNPGNDLYRFQAEGTAGCAQAAGCLTDLTADPTDEDGAEVKGVLGSSEDGSRLYFAANAVLAQNTVENGAGPEEAQAGDCRGRIHESSTGECNLYLWEDDGTSKGQLSFIARLDAAEDPAEARGDAFDWAGAGGAGIGGIGSALERNKESRTSPSGGSLLFRSQRRLTAYDNQGLPEYYLYRVGQGIVCTSCAPTGAPPGKPPGLGSIAPLALRTQLPAALASRNLADDGRRFFFESEEALVAADVDASRDVYEWEAPGAGSCEEGTPPYSPTNGGCLYLLSDGAEAEPSYFTDASASGRDAFILTRGRLVGQDGDQLLDLYDARVEGGLVSQSPPPPEPCEGAESCRSQVTPPPGLADPATPSFQGEGNVRPKPPKCPKGTHKVRRHGKTRCVKKPRRPHHGHHENHKRRHRRSR
jgi:hypothetical protein